MNRAALATLALLLAAVVAASALTAYAHVTYVYNAEVDFQAYHYYGLYFVVPPSPPPYCDYAVRYFNHNNISFTAIGYAFTLQNGSKYMIRWPAVIANSSAGGYAVLYLGGSKVYSTYAQPGQVFELFPVLSSPVSSTTIYLGQLNFSPAPLYPGVWLIYKPINVTVKYPANVKVLSFVDGQSYQTTLWYQGVTRTTVNKTYPYDLSGTKAASYWDEWYSGSATQPVMKLVSLLNLAGGAVVWKQSYTSGKNVTMVAVATFSNSSGQPADGIVFYLFITPAGWDLDADDNQSAAFTVPLLLSTKMSPVMGNVILYSTSSNVLLVQWDPHWYYNYTQFTGATGPWNIWVYKLSAPRPNASGGVQKPSSYTIEPSPSPNLGSPWTGWDGYGSWSPSPWVPRAGDYVLICVTYDATHNMLYGFVQDLSWPLWTASFSVSLGSYFSVPASSTSYAFGVGAATNTSYANWAIVFANVTQW